MRKGEGNGASKLLLPVGCIKSWGLYAFNKFLRNLMAVKIYLNNK
jgi:hypothetical protein